MPLATKTLYGIISLLIALLVITSTVAAYYYSEYNMASTNNNRVNSELESATAKYTALASNYNSELASYNGSVSSFEKLAAIYNMTSASFLSISEDYNTTFSLLVNTVAQLNTSSNGYVNASKTLATLWNQYLGVVTQYRQQSSSFESILSSFEAKNNVSLHEKTVPISLLTSNILIDFGNGTSDWFNNTSVEPQWNLYVASLVITHGNLNATYYPAYSEHFVTGIDGVQNSNTKFWFLWTYNSTSSWQVAQVGPDLLPTYNGSVYAWTYCGEDQNYNPTCTP
jgi:hypothetical protein